MPLLRGYTAIGECIRGMDLYCLFLQLNRQSGGRRGIPDFPKEADSPYGPTARQAYKRPARESSLPFTCLFVLTRSSTLLFPTLMSLFTFAFLSSVVIHPSPKPAHDSEASARGGNETGLAPLFLKGVRGMCVVTSYP